MKTEQEQIKAIKQIIDERVETTLGYVQGRHGNVIKTVDTIIIARDIVEAGYGDVSEYKAEIERVNKELSEKEEYHRITQALCHSYRNDYWKTFQHLEEQQQEIERLKSENEELTKVVSSKVYDFIDNTKEIADAREAWEKQAQIEVLNELKEKYGLYYLSVLGVKERMLSDVLNPMIEELKK